MRTSRGCCGWLASAIVALGLCSLWIADARGQEGEGTDPRPPNWAEDYAWLAAHLKTDLHGQELWNVLDAWSPKLVEEPAAKPAQRDEQARVRWIVIQAGQNLWRELRLKPGREQEKLGTLGLLRRAYRANGRLDLAAEKACAEAEIHWRLGAVAATRSLLDEDFFALREGRPYFPFAYGLLADVEQYEGQWDHALDLVQRGLEVANELRDEAHLQQEVEYRQIQQASLRGVEAGTYLSMGLADRARPLLEKALQQVQSIPGIETRNPGILLRLWIQRANQRLGSSRHEQLIDEVDEVLDSFPFPANRGSARAALLVRRGVAHLNLAYDDTRHVSAARSDLQQALEVVGIRPLDSLNACMRLAQLMILEQDFTAAAGWLEKVLGLLQSSSEESGLQWSAQEWALYAALHYRVVAETVPLDQREEAELQLLQRFQEMLQEWSQRPLRSGGTGYLAYERVQRVLQEVSSLHRSRNELASALECWMEAQCAGSLARQLGAEPATPAQILERLVPPGGGILHYLPGLERTLVVVIDGTGMDCFELAGRESIRRRVRGFLDQLQERFDRTTISTRQQQLEATAASMTELLLPAPVRERVRNLSSLVVCGTALLESAPLECLRWEGSWLGVETALSYLPSLPVGMALVQRQTRAVHRRFMLLSGAKHSAQITDQYSLSPLQPGPEDLQQIAAAYPREQRSLLQGSAATLDALLEQSVNPLGVWQFLTHGVLDASEEIGASLVLTPSEASPRGLLNSRQVQSMQVAPLVVLASCHSGIGPRRDSQASHLGGAFLLAGSNTVLLSPVALRYRPSVDLTALFHRALLEGESPAEALRQARLQLLEQGVFTDPLHHSMLQVMGLAHEPLFAEVEEEPSRPLWILVAALLVAAVAILFLRSSTIRSRTNLRRYEGRAFPAPPQDVP